MIRPALLWCDGRTTAECREITQRVGGEDRLRELASNPALEGFTLPKVLWLRNHEPEAFARLATVLLAKDYIRYRLTGELATEPSDASATLMYDTARSALERGDPARGGVERVARAARRRIVGGSRSREHRRRRRVLEWPSGHRSLAAVRTTRAVPRAWA